MSPAFRNRIQRPHVCFLPCTLVKVIERDLIEAPDVAAVTDPRASSMPPRVTLGQVAGFGLTAGKLVFAGDFVEIWDQAKCNIRSVGQVL